MMAFAESTSHSLAPDGAPTTVSLIPVKKADHFGIWVPAAVAKDCGLATANATN